MNDRVYKLVDREGNTIYQGSYDECVKRELDKLEYVGISTPIYRATNDEGIDVEGTMQELSEILDTPLLTLYNYTRFKRKYDGLFIEKIGDKVFTYDKD